MAEREFSEADFGNLKVWLELFYEFTERIRVAWESVAVRRTSPPDPWAFLELLVLLIGS